MKNLQWDEFQLGNLSVNLHGIFKVKVRDLCTHFAFVAF